MDLVNTHYDKALSPLALKTWGKEMAESIVNLCSDKSHPILIYTGLSGITAATAISINLPDNFSHGLAYVRKNGEKSHGCKVERGGNYPATDIEKANAKYIFVDDFYASGKTATRVFAEYQLRMLVTIAENQVFDALTREEVVRPLLQESILKGIKKNNKKILKLVTARNAAIKDLWG